jgi:error-prone DNA polymerase
LNLSSFLSITLRITGKTCLTFTLAATKYYTGDDAKRLFLLAELGIPLVATNDVHYHHPNRRELQDVLTCIREKCTIFNAGYKLHQNAERHLKEKPEMERLFRNYPEAITNAGLIAEACRFDLKSLKYKYPSELTTDGRTPQQQLEYLTWKGANALLQTTSPKKLKKPSKMNWRSSLNWMSLIIF